MNEERLNSSHRCDRCGAQAYVRASFMEGELLFCAHHYTKFHKSITSQAIWVHEQLEDLVAR